MIDYIMMIPFVVAGAFVCSSALFLVYEAIKRRYFFELALIVLTVWIATSAIHFAKKDYQEAIAASKYEEEVNDHLRDICTQH